MWSFVNVNAAGDGTNFIESNDIIMKNLTFAGFDPVILMETKGWNAKSGKKFNMKKDDVVNIPDSMRVFKIGLGWDTKLEIDCSLLLLDNLGRTLETVYFGNLRSKDGSVVHSGDNTSGAGKGDDEVITVYLDRNHKPVHQFGL